MSVIEINRPATPHPQGAGTRPCPFADTRDPRLYFPAPGHAAVLAELLEILESGRQSFAAVTGASGSGKTLLRSLLHGRLDPGRFVRVSIESSLLDFDSLLLELMSQVSGRRALANDWPDRYARLTELKRFLAQQVVRSNRRLVILLDEAQGLTAEDLELLRLFSNITTEQGSIMTFVLFGTPQLERILHALPELARRIGQCLVIEPLDGDATKSYVLQQLKLSGRSAFVEFSPAGWADLQRITGGVPGLINQTMSVAMRLAAAKCSAVTDDILAGLPCPSSPMVDDPGLLDWKECPR